MPQDLLAINTHWLQSLASLSIIKMPWGRSRNDCSVGCQIYCGNGWPHRSAHSTSLADHLKILCLASCLPHLAASDAANQAIGFN